MGKPKNITKKTYNEVWSTKQLLAAGSKAAKKANEDAIKKAKTDSAMRRKEIRAGRKGQAGKNTTKLGQTATAGATISQVSENRSAARQAEARARKAEFDAEIQRYQYLINGSQNDSGDLSDQVSSSNRPTSDMQTGR